MNVSVVTSLAGCNGFYMEGNLGSVSASNVDDFVESYGLGSSTRKDVYIGCYFTASYDGTDQTFRVAGFDTGYTGNITYGSLGKRHTMIVPDNYIELSYVVRSSYDTEDGYYNSFMNQYMLSEIVDINLQNIFGNHLIQFYDYLTSSVDSNMINYNCQSLNGVVNGNTLAYYYSILMSEIELWGKRIYSCNNGNLNVLKYMGERQLPLFWHNPKYIICNNAGTDTGENCWLRDIASSTTFCYVDRNGAPMHYAATRSGAVRPRFALG